jgi:S-DNA-T family DNA segregation ATPase FtsK/SpoIIIE
MPPGRWPCPQVGQLIANYQGGTQDSADDEEWLRLVESRCKGALQQFQLQSKLLTKALTPNAALLKFQGSANLTVEQVLRRRSEFLTTHGLNVISVRAEPGVIAIAIARPVRRVLHLPDVWKKWNPDCARRLLWVRIGNCRKQTLLQAFEREIQAIVRAFEEGVRR